MTLHKSAAIAIGTLAVTCMALAHQQEPKHAPTIAQCQADVKLWYNTADATEYTKAQDALNDDNTPNRTAYATLPISEVRLRMLEMTDCARVDDANFRNYHEAHEFYYGIFNDRLFRFMQRHNLFPQFATEDAEGKR
jgi:hypothetical protein